MRLSTKGRYAVTAMLNLAIHDPFETMTLADISQRQGISLSYLEQLFAKLRKQKLVKGMRGPGGGYRLAKAGDEISVAQIIAAVDGEPGSAARGKVTRSRKGQRRVTQELWDELSERLYTFLDGITLADLADRPDVKAVTDQHLKERVHSYPTAKKSAA